MLINKRIISNILILISILKIQFSFSQTDNNSLFRLPVVNTISEMNSIISPNSGSMVFNNENKRIYFYDGSSWLKYGSLDAIIVKSKSVSTNFTPPNNTNFIEINGVIPPIIHNVLTDDLLCLELSFSVDYGHYNHIGDIVGFNIYMDGTLTNEFDLFEGSISGGDNFIESGYINMVQYFKITRNANIEIRVKVKHTTTQPRVLSSNNLGKGGLKLTILR